MASTISGIVYGDLNVNARRDAGENGLPQADFVYADYNYNGRIDTGEASATVAGDGSYMLTGVRNTNFALRSSVSGALPNYAGGRANDPYFFNLTRDTKVTGRDFRLNVRLSNVSGTAYVDSIHNNRFDPGEATVGAGVVVFADNSDDGRLDADETRTTTDAQGRYNLSFVGGGGFAGREGFELDILAVPPSGLALGNTPQVSTDPAVARTFTGRDIGLLGTITPPTPPTPPTVGSVIGVIFTDADGNGRRNNDEGAAAGRTVYADYDYDGTLDSGEPTAASDTTGRYELSAALRPFALRLIPIAGSTQTAPANNGPFFVAPMNRRLVASAEPNFGVRGSVVPPTTTTISGTIYDDANANGRRDAGEGPFVPRGLGNDAGAYLDANDNGRADVGERGASADRATGRYTITGVPLGSTQNVRFVVDFTTFRPTQPAGLGDLAKYVVQASASTAGVAYDAGFTTQGGIAAASGFRDLNNDGVFQDGEPGIGRVWIDLDRDARRDADEPYLRLSDEFFGNGEPADNIRTPVLRVPFGNYRLAFDTDDDGVGEQSRDISLTAANPGVFVRFAVATPTAASVVGNVYDDANGNARRDNGEAGVAGRSVYADYDYDGTRDSGEPTAATDANGRYELNAALRAFALRLIPVSGSTQTAPANNGPFFVAPVNGRLFVGAQPDFGVRGSVVPPATTSISGFVYQDANRNGRRDAGEPGIAAVTGDSAGRVAVYLDLDRDGVRGDGEPATEADLVTGAYRFDGLPVGATFDVRLASDVGVNLYYLSQPVGFDAVRAVTTAAAASAGVDFGFARGGVVTGIPYVDANRNGRYDGSVDDVNNDPADENTRVGQPGTYVQWIDLDRDGALDAGEPRLVEYLSRGGQATYPQRALPDGSYRLAFARGQAAVGLVAQATVDFAVSLGANFGAVYPVSAGNATIRGTVFADDNRNGRRDAGEIGANGSVVYADYDYDGAYDANEPFAAVVNGTYTLDVLSRPFALRLSPLGGRVQTAPANNGAHFYEVRNGAVVGYGTDFGVATPASSVSVGLNIDGAPGLDAYRRFFEGSHFVFVDRDADGRRDADEPVLDRVPAFDGQDVRSVGAVPVGTSSIAVATSDCVGAAAVARQAVTVAAGEAVAYVDFVLPPVRPTVVGNLFRDADGDGVRDANEFNLAPSIENGYGLAVFADYDDDGVRDADEPAAQLYTDPQTGDDPELNGFYVLTIDPNRAASIVATGTRFNGPGGPRPLTRTTPTRRITLAGGGPAVGIDYGFVG